MLSRRFIRIVFFTILAYRLGTYTVIYFWGNTSWWQSVYSDNWNHYQLGFVFLVVALLLKKTRYPNISLLLTGIGTGMMIDEITDLIKLFHLYPLPPHFRDSLPDLGLIIATFSLFSLVVLFIAKLQKHRDVR